MLRCFGAIAGGLYIQAYVLYLIDPLVTAVWMILLLAIVCITTFCAVLDIGTDRLPDYISGIMVPYLFISGCLVTIIFYETEFHKDMKRCLIESFQEGCETYGIRAKK
jgi:hypothetical protein